MPTFVSYAQNFEDVILRRVLRDVLEGFYVDVGAQHPLRDSVTRAFYERGWRGINIEPVAEWHGLLQVDRPEDLNLKLAIGDKEGSIAFYEVQGTGLSTTDSEIAARHALEGFDVTMRTVPVSTLDSVLAEHGRQEIHFLKIDVEGGERNVLKGLSLDRYRPWVIVIEATQPNSQEESSSEWEWMLLEKRYQRVYGDGLNQFYLADEHADLAPRFAHPPNFFDNFVRHLDWERAENARHLAEENERLVLQADDAEERTRVAQERARAVQERLREAEARAREAETRVTAAESEAAALADRISVRERRIAELEHELGAMLASRSWRITRPLRQLSSAFGAARSIQRMPATAAPPDPRPSAGVDRAPEGAPHVPGESRLLELATRMSGEPVAPRRYAAPVNQGRLDAILSELHALSYPPRTLPSKLERLPGASVLRTPILRFYERLFRKQSLINARMTEALRIILENQRHR